MSDTVSPDSPESKSSVSLTKEQITREHYKIKQHLKRAEKAGTPATLTLEEWLKILDRYEWRCAYCKGAPYHVLEHCLSIKAGGGTTAENCVPSCTACNLRKYSSHAVIDLEANTVHFHETTSAASPKRRPRLANRWFTEDELLTGFHRISQSQDEIVDIITCMLMERTLIKQSTRKGIIYRFTKKR